MNGVARAFWKEVYDLQAPGDDRRARRASRGRKKAVRRVQGPRRDKDFRAA